MKSPFSLFRRNKNQRGWREDRIKSFYIKRIKNTHGFYVFVLENLQEQRRIYIPHFVFGRFRACLKQILLRELLGDSAQAFEEKVGFLNKDYFYFKSSQMDLQNLIIQDLDEPEGSSGYLTVARRDVKSLSDMLYSEALQHPSDVLGSIVSYHKMFQFSFVKTSKSITSDLILRKDILQDIVDYKPSLAARSLAKPKALSEEDQQRRSDAAHFAKSQSPLKKANYQPRLGERFHDREIKVDYGQLFSAAEKRSASEDKIDKNKRDDDSSLLTHFPLSLSAADLKKYGEGKFRLILSSEEANEFRNRFICDRSSEFYLGFEIVDTLFMHRKLLKTLRFPLYYLKVSVRESGREVRLQIKDDGKVYLNHLALANLVNKFGNTKTEMAGLGEFFNTLLVQQLNIDQITDRISLCRHLPFADAIFDRAREILFGFQGENGKGGILGHLSFKGVECDLNSVILYRAPSLLSPLEQALEIDVDTISRIAHSSVNRFYASLLGKFLTPELAVNEGLQSRAQPVWMPGRRSKSTQLLMDKLNHHDIVLLEGPPGTGKTHTIRNLMIDNICQGKRVLVVSDQQAAIEALLEKIQDYLYQHSRFDAEKAEQDSLLFGALKVLATIPDTSEKLSDVLAGFVKVLQVSEQPNVLRRKTLTSKVSDIDKLIQGYSAAISRTMAAHLDESVAYDKRLPLKSQPAPQAGALLRFLQLNWGGKPRAKGLISKFITYRLALISRGMPACYSYFKLPHRHFEQVILGLQGDVKTLESLVSKRPADEAAFLSVTEHAPHNELFVYLRRCLELEQQKQNQRAGPLSGVFSAKKNTHFEKSAIFLAEVATLQIEILRQASAWPTELMQMLEGIHETIRLGDKPDYALSLYRRVAVPEENNFGSEQASIQTMLERIEDLIVQRDHLVYERFVATLNGICHQALENKQRTGTNAITRILALLENLQQFKRIDESGDVFVELRNALLETFPVWMLRKQLVPLLLPCREKSFDLVIVDEATQCRVDDALSLMFRAKKILVVGDDKQTVLQKDSVVDDYLFKDHELDEHLRSTQARGFKGGGSNIFALIKSIKQAGVMLDEHYRCPADIIHFSNRYVYENKLKVMQWRLPEQAPAVVIDDSEKKIEPGRKPSSGKFKGIETQMVDRFLEFVRRGVLRLEKQLGRRINLETDVALCYFLLKNQPYMSEALGDFLTKMNRGDFILHGAGASLQGKERDYIFYLWDITRYNMAAFSQGDEEDKRRGELNVLMSRPKKVAFHYLHHAFHKLDHSRASIATYLHSALARSASKPALSHADVTANDFFYQALNFTVENASQRGLLNLQQRFSDKRFNFREHIVVGSPLRKVDLVVFPGDNLNAAVGIVDLCYFSCGEQSGDEIIDYYFQLKRAQPTIDPVFLFNYELIDPNSSAFISLVNKLNKS